MESKMVWGTYNGVTYYTEEEWKHAIRHRGAFESDEELIAFAEEVTYGWSDAGWKRTFASYPLFDGTDEPRHSLTRAEFARLKELQAQARAEWIDPAYKQIGWITFRDDMEFCDNGYECAAWYQDIAVKAGKYPLYILKMKIGDDGKVSGDCPEQVVAKLPGKVVRDDFGARFCGVPIGGYDGSKNAGKDTKYFWTMYIFDYAKHIGEGKGFTDGTSFELLPEYEVRKETFFSTAFNEELTMWEIYKK